MSWVVELFAGIGAVFTLGFAGIGTYLVVDWLREVGRWVGCDRHQWRSGDEDTTRRWRVLYRGRWHRIRWHSLPGQQPFGATDQWIVDNADWLLSLPQNRGRRWRRGVEMARAAWGDKPTRPRL